MEDVSTVDPLLTVKRTVLIIDDSEVIRNHVRRALQQAGVFSQYLTGADGLEGFKLLLTHEVDLVLCDVVMPGIDGFKFLSLKNSRPEYSEVPVIMLTGQEDVDAKVKGLSNGASDYLTKPFHDEELVARVRVHLKIKALQDELREKNDRLEVLSQTDALTRIPNRRHFLEALELEFLRAERYDTALSCVMVDIDHFKKLNDNHGHLAGDRALVTVAAILQAGLRQNDMVGRYGGEEFALLLPNTDPQGALAVAERCRKEVELAEMVFVRQTARLTVSMGIAALPDERISSVDDLIRLADNALYAAKRGGRNRVVVTNSGDELRSSPE